MKYLFKEFLLEDQHTLFIIGNGFDITCGIKSKYVDFRQWLKSNNTYPKLYELMEHLFNNCEYDFWGDIEKALGEYDEEQIMNACNLNPDIDYDHPIRYVSSIESTPDMFKSILDEFLEAFNNWVNSIDITCAKKIGDLPQDSKYLTFNYTETLEKIYRIPKDNVLHIHGSRLSKEKGYIIGHNNYRDRYDAYDKSQLYFIQKAQEDIIDDMNGLVKDTKSIIIQNQNFFHRLSNNIERVVVYGHSLSQIDRPYIDEIVKQIGIDEPWVIYYHTEDDNSSIESFVKEKGLSNVRKELW